MTLLIIILAIAVVTILLGIIMWGFWTDVTHD